MEREQFVPSPMSVASPHFLLFSESRRGVEQGRWRFVLESLDGTDKLEATDIESDVHGERLELLAVVRGLEALSQPSRVTLVTPSRYVDRGLSDGLPEWRSNNWQWEHFGEMAPVKNRDLWQRVDRALEYHQVDCRLRRVDEPLPTSAAQHALTGPNYLKRRRASAARTNEIALRSEIMSAPKVTFQKKNLGREKLRSTWRRKRVKFVRCFRETLASLKIRLSQLGTGLSPPPWLN
jgi:ribonuclease HI